MSRGSRWKGAAVVVGAQWGDEGKGKVVDVLAAQADAVVRYHGGGNAGHTLVINGKKVVTHILPVGIARLGKINLVGPYVVCDPEVIVQELAIAREAGSIVHLDSRAPVVLPLHRQLDGLRERAAGSAAIGTTGRGIGPCYEDVSARRGVTLGDFVDPDRFHMALTTRGFYDERAALIRHHGGDPMSLKQLMDWAQPFMVVLRPHLVDTLRIIAEISGSTNGSILCEGAQGVMLDVLYGRPFCTSSFCTPAAASASLGLPTFDRVIGVAKAYLTRVGAGPFPTEFVAGEWGDWLERLREGGKEYGATTGRPRRCGALDLMALDFACRVAGIRELVITKLDVLSGAPSIPVCIRYTQGGVARVYGHATLTAELLGRVEPECIRVQGWSEDLGNCRSWESLPAAAQAYLAFIENFVSARIVGVSVGPERDQIIWR